MAEVKFKRKSTTEIENLPVDDGSFIVNYETGNAYIDYENERVQVSGGASGGGETLPVGTELDFDGTSQDIPVGWEQVDDIPVYSTNETICGTWIDGKPVYRKYLKYTTKANEYNVSSLNIDTLIKNDYFQEVYFSDTNRYYKRGTYYLNENDYFLAFLRNNTLQVRDATDSNSFISYYFILEYTKTTD